MAQLYEMLKGLSDIPIALIALVFGVLLRKKNKEWSSLFLLITVSAVLGAVVHTFDFPRVWNRVIWIVLYIFLYELIRRFAHLMVCYISGRAERERTLVYILEALLYGVTVVFMFAVSINDIYILVLFALIMLVRVVTSMVKFAPALFKARLLMAVLLFPLVLQALEEVIPYAVLIEHIILAAALCIAFSMAKEEK